MCGPRWSLESRGSGALGLSGVSAVLLRGLGAGANPALGSVPELFGGLGARPSWAPDPWPGVSRGGGLQRVAALLSARRRAGRHHGHRAARGRGASARSPSAHGRRGADVHGALASSSPVAGATWFGRFGRFAGAGTPLLCSPWRGSVRRHGCQGAAPPWPAPSVQRGEAGAALARCQRAVLLGLAGDPLGPFDGLASTGPRPRRVIARSHGGPPGAAPRRARRVRGRARKRAARVRGASCFFLVQVPFDAADLGRQGEGTGRATLGFAPIRQWKGRCCQRSNKEPQEGAVSSGATLTIQLEKPSRNARNPSTCSTGKP